MSTHFDDGGSDSTGSAKPLTDLCGTTLGDRYELAEVLGAGGMGAVFKAKDRLLDRPVAIKVIRPALAEGADYIKRFLREAQTASKIRHRNVVMSLDYGEVEGLVYSVMELLEGKDIKQLINDSPDGRLPWAQACDLLAQVASGLRAAHEKGVIHRDIKPANCFVIEEDGHAVVKLVDFGIAKVDDPNDAEQITHTSQVLGTPSYIAPELVRTRGSASPRADVYSMGVMAYRLLTGNLPFTGETAFEVMYRACSEPVPPLRKQVPDVPAEVEQLVLDMLAKDPEQRPADMTEVRDQLRAALAREGKATAGSRRWWVLGGVVLAVVLGGVGWSIAGGTRDEGAGAVAAAVEAAPVAAGPVKTTEDAHAAAPAAPAASEATPQAAPPTTVEAGEPAGTPETPATEAEPADGDAEATSPPEDPPSQSRASSSTRSRREGSGSKASAPARVPEAIPTELSDADLQSVRAKAAKASRACGRTHMSLTSTLQVELEVEPSGTVSKAAALAPMDVQPEGQCVAKEIARIRFPESQQGVSKTWSLPLR